MKEATTYKGISRIGNVFTLPENHELYVSGGVSIRCNSQDFSAIVTAINSEDITKVTIMTVHSNIELPETDLTIVKVTNKSFLEKNKTKKNLMAGLYKDVMKDTIQKRKGKIVFGFDFFKTCNENYLKALFSNFFPIAIDPSHKTGFYGQITYYGLSPYFDEIEQGEVIPEYEITLSMVDDQVIFEQMKKL